jgi:hypothetical protein
MKPPLKPWRPDLGLLIFIVAGVALCHVAAFLAFGHLEPGALTAVLVVGAGLGTLGHYLVSRRRP